MSTILLYVEGRIGNAREMTHLERKWYCSLSSTFGKSQGNVEAAITISFDYFLIMVCSEIRSCSSFISVVVLKIHDIILYFTIVIPERQKCQFV